MFRLASKTVRALTRPSMGRGLSSVASPTASHEVSTGLKVASAGLVGLATILVSTNMNIFIYTCIAHCYQYAFPDLLKSKPAEEKQKKAAANFENFAVETAADGAIVFTWTEGDYKCRVPLSGTIGEVEKTYSPPAPKAVATVEVPKSTIQTAVPSAPPAAGVATANNLTEAPSEGLTRVEGGWVIAWKKVMHLYDTDC